MTCSAKAGAITVCLRIAEVPYELEIIPREEFSSVKGDEARFPLGQMPVLTFPDGRIILQSVAIARYAAKLAGLYPDDPLEALEVDEIVDSIHEVINNRPKHSDQDILKPLVEEWVAGKLQKFLRYINRKAEKGRSYLVGGKLTLADVYLYQILKRFRNGSDILFVPTDVDSPHPALGLFFQFIKTDSVFAPYA